MTKNVFKRLADLRTTARDIIVKYSPSYYIKQGLNVHGHLRGIDNALGDIGVENDLKLAKTQDTITLIKEKANTIAAKCNATTDIDVLTSLIWIWTV
jgi:hypothetical protein